FECCFFCIGVHPSGELDAGTTSACFDPLLTHRLPPSGRRGFLSNRRCSLLLLWGFGVRLPMRSIASLWRLLVAHVLLRVVRRRPRRSIASGRILLRCMHTVRKAALLCRFLVSPQCSACVRGQSLSATSFGTSSSSVHSVMFSRLMTCTVARPGPRSLYRPDSGIAS